MIKMKSIHIQNLGPIQECQLDLRDCMVFIGPQASGKSTLTKAVYFFRSLRDDYIQFIYECISNGKIEKPISSFRKMIRKKFLNYWGSSYHMNDMYLKFVYKDAVHIEITLEDTKRYVNTQFSPELEKELMRVYTEAKEYIVAQNNEQAFLKTRLDLIRQNTFMIGIEKQLQKLFEDDKELVFIPAGRSLLATLTEQIQQLNSEKLDVLMGAFLERINNNKKIFNKKLSELVYEKKKLSSDKINTKMAEMAADLIGNILRGEYRNDYDGEKIYVSESKYTKLNYSSSGQQEVIWILHLIFLFVLERRNVFMVIEEPEAHLFPEAQKELVKLIFLMANSNCNEVVLTTHSPYVLSSVNNLIYAHLVGKRSPQSAAEVIPLHLWVDPERTGAYFVDNGSIRNLINPELGLIQAEAIDSVSNHLNDEYDRLLDLETPL